MKKLIVFLVAGVLAGGCLVRHHGHVSMFPPPGLLVAGAIAASLARPGYVWVEGHWDWSGDRWVWSDGMWIDDRPGLVWVQGGWVFGQDRYYWRPGHWRPR